MSLSKRLVVTNHSNHDLEWLSDLNDYGFTPENIYIYERSGNGIQKYEHYLIDEIKSVFSDFIE